ncbi:CENP-B homolog protein 2-like protein [Tanacetum coccineum]
MMTRFEEHYASHNKDKSKSHSKAIAEWVHNFTFSIGWLGKFKARYGIKNFRRFGESGSVEMEGMEDKLKSIRDKVDQFEMKDIFNMDETGLFFRLQPDHSLATMQLEGKKQDKERLTVAICCNEDGSEKLPLWIIGKYAKPDSPRRKCSCTVVD